MPQTLSENTQFLNALPGFVAGFDFNQNEPKSVASALDARIIAMIESKEWNDLDALVRCLKSIHDQRQSQKLGEPSVQDEWRELDRGKFTWYIRTFRAIFGFRKEKYGSSEFNEKREAALNWIQRGFSRESGTAFKIATTLGQFDVAEALFPSEHLPRIEKEILDTFIQPKRSRSEELSRDIQAFAEWWCKQNRESQISSHHLSALIAKSKVADAESFSKLTSAWAANWVRQKRRGTHNDQWWSDTVCLSAEAAIEGAHVLTLWLDELKKQMPKDEWKELVRGKKSELLIERYSNDPYNYWAGFVGLQDTKKVHVKLLAVKLSSSKWTDWCLSHGLLEAATVWEGKGALPTSKSRLKEMLSKSQASDAFGDHEAEKRERIVSGLERRLLFKHAAIKLPTKKTALAL